MRIVYLIREAQRSDRDETLGWLYADGRSFATLELPWRQNLPNVSCIPAGDYVTSFLPRSASGKYRNVFHVTSVVGRAGILIHTGNVVAHTRGCILIGSKHGTLGGRRSVLGSRLALVSFTSLIERESFLLRIL